MTCIISLVGGYPGHTYDLKIESPLRLHAYVSGFYSPLDFRFFILIGRR